VLVERKLGRRVTDLRRLASLLPRIGTIASGPTGDSPRLWSVRSRGAADHGVSWRNENRGSGLAAGAFRVGGEVDSWCGPCDGLTTHHIVAMVGATPQSGVVCQACGNRHNYRTTPARKASATEGSAPASSPQETEAARRAEQKAEELRATGTRAGRRSRRAHLQPRASATKSARSSGTQSLAAARLDDGSALKHAGSLCSGGNEVGDA